MNSPRCLAALVVTTLLAACGARTVPEHDGDANVFRYANGNRWAEFRLEQGQPDGTWRTWWPDGSKKSVETWVDGHLDGPFESWFENGQPMASGTYQNDRRHGPWHHGYDDGTPRQIETWNAGVLHGSSKGWFANGKPQHESEYANGEPTGTGAQWFENGHPKTRTTWRDLDGAEEIVRQLWYEDGSRRFDGRYVDGLLDGTIRFWHDDGRLDPEVSGVYERNEKVAVLPVTDGE